MTSLLLDMPLPYDNTVTLLQWISFAIGGTLIVFALLAFTIFMLRRK